MKKFFQNFTERPHYYKDNKAPQQGGFDESRFDNSVLPMNQNQSMFIINDSDYPRDLSRDISRTTQLQQIIPQIQTGPINDKIKTVRIRLVEDKKKKDSKSKMPNPTGFRETFKAEVKAKDQRFKELGKTIYMFYTPEDLLSQLTSCSYFRGFKPLDFDHIKVCLFKGCEDGTDLYTQNKKKSTIQELKYYVTLTDEGQYHGQMNKNKAPEGLSIFYYKNGNKYMGQMKNRFRHGQGTMTWPDGSVYAGQWSLDAQDGLGQEKDAKGEIYTGNFSNNARSGKGVLQFNKGYVLEGNWVNGKQEGLSTLSVGKQKISVQWSRGQMIKINQTALTDINDSHQLPPDFIQIQFNKDKVQVNYQAPYCLTAQF